MDTETTQARPRAYYPDYVGSAPQHGRTPGWDVPGPERRIDDGHTAARVLGWLGVGLVGVLVARKLTRSRKSHRARGY
jgi:hypothetical protein